jgi:hypothetical protein
VDKTRRLLFGGLLFVLGFVAGGMALFCWQHFLVPTPTATYQATLFVPLVNPEGREFSDQEWETAFRPFTEEFGGATFADKHEGWWHDPQRRLHREPVRVVIISFGRDRLPTFRRAVRELGRRLGQEAMYFRLEEVQIEILNVADEKSHFGS